MCVKKERIILYKICKYVIKVIHFTEKTSSIFNNKQQRKVRNTIRTWNIEVNVKKKKENRSQEVKKLQRRESSSQRAEMMFVCDGIKVCCDC